LLYQIKYRINSIKPLISYINRKDYRCTGNPLYFSGPLPTKAVVENQDTFKFLNKSKSFVGNVQWDFNVYGKLWNYNLQYFELLAQKDMSINDKERLLVDFYSW